MVGALVQVGNIWTFRMLQLPAKDGQHFIDILEPVIGDFVRSVIPTAPMPIKAAFAMEKGSVVDLPKSTVLQAVTVGLGWGMGGGGGVDLDVSAVLLDNQARSIDAVFFGNLSVQGVTHSGDDLAGKGSRDEEVITVNLQALTPAVQQIAFIINIYIQNKTFCEVINPYCRVMQADNSEELCHYKLSEAGGQEALIIARLFKDISGVRWGFQALGQPAAGRTWTESKPSISGLCIESPRAMQARLEFAGGGGSASPSVAPIEPAPEPACCVMQ